MNNPDPHFQVQAGASFDIIYGIVAKIIEIRQADYTECHFLGIKPLAFSQWIIWLLQVSVVVSPVRYGSDKALYFDAYIWNEQYEDIAFEYVENFRNIPNPRIAKGYAGIIGRHGNDQEKWEWSGQNKIKKSAVTKDYYK